MSQSITPAPQYASPAIDERPFNVLSIAAFVLSLFGLSIIPIVLGHIGLSQTRTRNERGRGFAIAALIIGYVSLVIEVILVILVVLTVGIAASSGVITSR
jgi:hypothetical protein